MRGAGGVVDTLKGYYEARDRMQYLNAEMNYSRSFFKAITKRNGKKVIRNRRRQRRSGGVWNEENGDETRATVKDFAGYCFPTAPQNVRLFHLSANQAPCRGRR